jgi:hypothetical protein
MITRDQINKALEWVSRKHGIMSSSDNSQVATPSVWPIWRQRTRTGGEFIHNYSAFKAKEMFSPYNIQKSLCGEVPTLAQALEAYKYKDFVTWMTGQLTNLCTYMGYANMPNSVQVEGIADQFLQKYPFLRVTEVMYYFECIKDGRYYEATIKLEPQALIKGVVKYLGDLNVMKERWGNAFEDFTPEKLKNVCIEILTDQGVDMASYDINAMAMLFGMYYPVSRQKYNAISEKVARLDNTWVLDLKKAS